MTKAEDDQLDRRAVLYGLPLVLVVFAGLVWFFRQQVRAELAVLGPRWGIAFAVLGCSVAISLVASLWRNEGTRAGIRQGAIYMGASVIPALIVFSVHHSASWLWFLLSVPVMLLLYFRDFLKGVFSRSVRLDGIDLDPSAASGRAKLRVAHLSDLHLCERPALEGGLSPERVREAARRALRWALERADFVLLTGDLTDHGSKEEWQNLAMLLSELGPDGAARVHLVPGNHDLSLTAEEHTSQDGGLVLEHEERHHHFATVILRACPPSWRIGTTNGALSLSDALTCASGYIDQYDRSPPRLGSLSEAVRGPWHRVVSRLLRARRDAEDPLARFAELIPPVVFDEALRRAASEAGANALWPSPGRLLFLDLVRDLYPMVFHEDERCISIGLNSNILLGDSIFTGAFGRLGVEQLERLDALLARSGDRLKILSLHHHIGEPPTLGLALSTSLRALLLEDAVALHKVLSRHKNIIVFHGHEHIGYRAMTGDITVVSAPSVAYGDCLRLGRPNCFVYGIDPTGADARGRVRELDRSTIRA